MKKASLRSRESALGLVANPASVDSGLTPTVRVLLDAPDVKLTALFGPEHGVWGDEYAGDKIEDKSDASTGLPAFSLYGKNRKPSKEMFDTIDVLVFDLQDIGSRSYTFMSTMHAMPEGCMHQYNKPLIILDRPNPLGGERIEGGPVDSGIRIIRQLHEHPLPARPDDGRVGATGAIATRPITTA